MNVASLELCRELYELSGWENDTYFVYALVDNEKTVVCNRAEDINEQQSWELICDAYDLGYLLRKLPSCSINHLKDGSYRAGWNGYDTRLPSYD